MAQSQFSLAWESHKKNICNGLSTLQQNGEFVDMTLAADGHFVKVHQVIVALASPYIKQLISSVECSHPVIFLNKISYTTLCAILEYIYTGEVLISIENLSELVDAAKELHIKGLEDMKLHETISIKQGMTEKNMSDVQEQDRVSNIESLDDEICYFEVSQAKEDSEEPKTNYTFLEKGSHGDPMSQNTHADDTYEEAMQQDIEVPVLETKPIIDDNGHAIVTKDPANVSIMQYTVSNQGSLQMILNRYIYYLKHTNRNNTRQWRCVEYLNVRCPAHVVTRDDVVIQRISAHTHPFHDKKILKKVSAGAIFTAIQDAEQEGNNKRKKNNDAKGESD